MRHNNRYTITREDGETKVFDRLEDLAKYFNKSVSFTYERFKKGERHEGWLISRESIKIDGKIRANAKKPRKHFKGKNKWEYSKYTYKEGKFPDILSCEKKIYASKYTTEEDLDNIKILIQKALILMFKERQFSVYFKSPKMDINKVRKRVLNNRVFTIEVNVAFEYIGDITDEIKEVEDKILTIDKVIKEYEERNMETSKRL